MITPCFAARGVPGIAPKARFPRPPAPVRLGPAVLVLLACLGAAAWSDVPPRSRRAAAPIFETRVRPLLAARCNGCHGPSRASGGLRLDSARGLLTGGAGGPVVVPGRPEQSRLIQAVEGRGGRRMPPDGRLSAGEISTLRQWISEGALVPPDAAANPGSAAGGHWAFRPLRLPAVPAVGNTERVRTPVDAFVLARLREKGLTAASDAARAVLIRRASFDLHGLPPTPAEVDAVLADPRPDAYERLLDRLLASPQFGVRWGRHWLDAAGYTDTVSFDEDFGPPIGTVEGKWRYRDYVVNAFNSDKPYDEFVREQLAGDEMTAWREAATYSPDVMEKLVATGYLRTVEDISLEDPRPFVIWSVVHETVEEVGANLLGLTLRCARCHDHKFEPVPQQDYYRLMALFTPALNPKSWKNAKVRLVPDISGAELADLNRHNAAIERATATQEQELTALRQPYALALREKKLLRVPEPTRSEFRSAIGLPPEKRSDSQKAVVARVEPLVKVEPGELDAALTEPDREATAMLTARIAALKSQRRAHGWIHAVYDVGAPPPTHLFRRGQFETPGDEVAPGFLSVLTDARSRALPAAPSAAGTSGRRTALARWLTDPASPASGLAARVLVNRIWQHLFGVGIVATSDNLGLSGAPPTHPALLEWLAADFRDHGWRIKRVIRGIMLSTVYRQDSVPDGPGKLRGSAPRAGDPQKLDPDNHLLWRQRLRRLDAEALRDAVLAMSGQLDPTLGGPPTPLVYQAATGLVTEADPGAAAPGRRRSLYLLNRRIYNPTLLAVFDKPTVTSGVCRRGTGATVLQSLALMNDTFLIGQAAAFADRILRAAGESPGARITLAFRLALGRRPAPEEAEWCRSMLEQQNAVARSSGASEREAAHAALASLCQTLWGANEFLYLR